jgi:prevent-host-death family protein
MTSSFFADPFLPLEGVLPSPERLDIMSNMKTATVREVQHGLASVLSQVQNGQEIAVTKHGKVIARIVPATRTKGRLRWPDSAASLKQLKQLKQLMSGATLTGATPSEIIRELRGERV